jgi:hypothetical protein
MNLPGTPDDKAKPSAPAKPPVSRRTLDEVFGDVLPDVTNDEIEDRSENGDRDADRWYRDNRPPHHG